MQGSAPLCALVWLWALGVNRRESLAAPCEAKHLPAFLLVVSRPGSRAPCPPTPQVADMAVMKEKNKLVGCSYHQSFVGLWVVDLKEVGVLE